MYANVTYPNYAMDIVLLVNTGKYQLLLVG